MDMLFPIAHCYQLTNCLRISLTQKIEKPSSNEQNGSKSGAIIREYFNHAEGNRKDGSDCQYDKHPVSLSDEVECPTDLLAQNMNRRSLRTNHTR